jgi:hypothetical protein
MAKTAAPVLVLCCAVIEVQRGGLDANQLLWYGMYVFGLPGVSCGAEFRSIRMVNMEDVDCLYLLSTLQLRSSMA